MLVFACFLVSSVIFAPIFVFRRCGVTDLLHCDSCGVEEWSGALGNGVVLLGTATSTRETGCRYAYFLVLCTD